MELWIRSQDKKRLVKAEHIYYCKDEFTNCIFITGAYDLGVYKTEERALEILDEIQEHIEKQGENDLLTDKNGIITGQKYYGFIYQMPKE